MARISMLVRSNSKRRELMAPHALANGDSLGNPLAGVEQVYD
jgi:hypothetical protein